MYRTMVGILNNAMDPASIEVGLGESPVSKKKTSIIIPSLNTGH
jgi:hypothetical protein